MIKKELFEEFLKTNDSELADKIVCAGLHMEYVNWAYCKLLDARNKAMKKSLKEEVKDE